MQPADFVEDAARFYLSIVKERGDEETRTTLTAKEEQVVTHFLRFMRRAVAQDGTAHVKRRALRGRGGIPPSYHSTPANPAGPRISLGFATPSPRSFERLQR